ncbi:MAG: hypothetical protein PHP05_09330 [Sideroxydans sp.]|nr:hypothetical protein [Sideroxydans sp.]
MKPLFSLAFALAVLLAGCASSLPPPDVMRAETANYQLPRSPAEWKALVYVVFDEDDYDMVWFDVFLDGQQTAARVGRNHGGQYFFFEMTPGEHTLYSKGEKWAELSVSAGAGEVIFVRQELEFGMLAARVNLSRLDEVVGKYHVSKLKPGVAVAPLPRNAPAGSTRPEVAASGAIVGTVTGGNFAKGFGFSTPNVKLLITPDGGGEPVVVYVRGDAKVYDAAGVLLDYMEAFRMYGKRVEIQPFLIEDATGGLPGRSDFGFEIGQQGARTLRVLGQ